MSPISKKTKLILKFNFFGVFRPQDFDLYTYKKKLIFFAFLAKFYLNSKNKVSILYHF